MNTIIKACIGWWQEREANERLWLQLGSLVVALVLILLICVQPAFQGRLQVLAELPHLRQQIAVMDAQAQEVQGLTTRDTVQPPTGEVLREAVATSLHDHGFQAKPLAGAGNAVRIELHDVTFANWAAWLDEVRDQLHVKVSEAHITALKPGQVDLTATLSPP